MFRDIPSFGVYFYVYDYSQIVFHTKEKENDENKTARVVVEKIIAGALAGQISWLTCFPFDVVKSYIQYHPEHTKMLETIRHIYARHGAGHFFKGLSP
mmetsp:Transcript_7537/g.8507  ORF Transcript_7537/g.8507 Transcript_7537/m.8507 type:complete len:98 (+) Transcript_7537:540-833(+)